MIAVQFVADDVNCPRRPLFYRIGAAVRITDRRNLSFFRHLTDLRSIAGDGQR